MLRFRCPKCRTPFEARPDVAGNKFECTVCGQRLEVPAPAPPKTMLGEIEPERELRSGGRRKRSSSAGWIVAIVLPVGFVALLVAAVGFLMISTPPRPPNASCPGCGRQFTIP